MRMLKAQIAGLRWHFLFAKDGRPVCLSFLDTEDSRSRGPGVICLRFWGLIWQKNPNNNNKKQTKTPKIQKQQDLGRPEGPDSLVPLPFFPLCIIQGWFKGVHLTPTFCRHLILDTHSSMLGGCEACVRMFGDVTRILWHGPWHSGPNQAPLNVCFFEANWWSCLSSSLYQKIGSF